MLKLLKKFGVVLFILTEEQSKKWEKCVLEKEKIAILQEVADDEVNFGKIKTVRYLCGDIFMDDDEAPGRPNFRLFAYTQTKSTCYELLFVSQKYSKNGKCISILFKIDGA